MKHTSQHAVEVDKPRVSAEASNPKQTLATGSIMSLSGFLGTFPCQGLVLPDCDVDGKPEKVTEVGSCMSVTSSSLAKTLAQTPGCLEATGCSVSCREVQGSFYKKDPLSHVEMRQLGSTVAKLERPKEAEGLDLPSSRHGMNAEGHCLKHVPTLGTCVDSATPQDDSRLIASVHLGGLDSPPNMK